MNEKKGELKKAKFGLFFVSALAVIIFAVVLVAALIHKNQINQVRIEGVPLYTWFNEERISYDEDELVFERIDNDTTLSIDGEKQEFIDSMPYYYENERKILFPQEMNIIQPRANNGQQNRLPTLSTIDGTGSDIKVTFANTKVTLGSAFLFDGRDVYFFVNPMELTVDGQTIKTSELTLVTYNFNHELYIYDYNANEARFIEGAESVQAKTDKYNVNLVTDTFEINGKSRLLVTNVGVLDLLK